MTHRLRSFPVLVTYMSRIHNAFFPDFPSPWQPPNPQSSLKANMIYYFSWMGFGSCVVNALLYIYNSCRFKGILGFLRTPRTSTQMQHKQTRDRVVSETVHNAKRPKAGKSKSIGPLCPERKATSSPASPKCQPSPLLEGSIQKKERGPNYPRKGKVSADGEPSQCPCTTRQKAMDTFSALLSTVPVVDLSVSVRDCKSQANLLELGSKDSLFHLANDSRRRVSILTPPHSTYCGCNSHNSTVGTSTFGPPRQQHPGDLHRVDSFSPRQVFPCTEGRTIPPSELPLSPLAPIVALPKTLAKKKKRRRARKSCHCYMPSSSKISEKTRASSWLESQQHD